MNKTEKEEVNLIQIVPHQQNFSGGGIGIWLMLCGGIHLMNAAF